MSSVGYVLALSCLCHMRLLFPCVPFWKDGDPYEYRTIVIELHNLLTVHYITFRTIAEKHATNIVPECKRTTG